jgi:hypothetical protein
VKGKKASFNGALGAGSNIDFDVTGSGVKETITVSTRPDVGDRIEFRSKVKLEGLTVRNTPAGVEFVGVDGSVRYNAPIGVAWDSSNPDSLLASKSVVSVAWDGDELVVAPDAGWMADPKTVFPVFIDPTITVEATRRVYVEQNNPNSAFTFSPQFIGNYYNRMRAYERFDTSTLPASIDSAEVVSRMQYCDGSYTQPVRVRKVTGPWGGPQGNPVLNASFETFPAGNPARLTEWSVRSPVHGSATRVQSPIGVGEAALKLSAGTGTWAAVESVPYPVVAGEQFWFQMDARAQNPIDWTVARVYFYTDVPASGWDAMTDGTGGVPNAVVAFADPVWVQPGQTVTAPVGGSYTVPAGVKYARISIHHNGAAGIVDNVVTMRNGNSLTANPGFSRVTGWSMRSGAGGFDDSSGSNLWMSSFNQWNAIASAPIAVRAGEELTVSAKVLTAGNAGVEVLRLEWYDKVPAAGWNAMTDNVMMANNADTVLSTYNSATWQTMGRKATVPAGAKWVRVSVHHTSNYGAIAIDDVTLTRPNLDPNPALTTWNTQPQVSTTETATGYSNYQLTDFPIVVTDMVRGWIANPASNYGIRLDMDNLDDTTGGPLARCSINGGYLRIIYNEGLAPLQPTAPNTLVNGGFESGTYQWNKCRQDSSVFVTTERDPNMTSWGTRFLRIDGAQNGGGAVCQWVAYDSDWNGDYRITATVNLRSRAGATSATVNLSQQGNENQGARYFQTEQNFAINPNSWTSVTLSMCEVSGRNNALALAVVASFGQSILVDNVSLNVARDSRPFAEGGCTPPPRPTPNPCSATSCPAPPNPDPCGTVLDCHYLDDGVPTDVRTLNNNCIGVQGVDAVITNDPNCLVVVPEFQGDGIFLRLEGQPSVCLGPVGTRLVVRTCEWNARITDVPNLANAVGTQFPIRIPVDNSGYSPCLDSSDLTFGPCDNVSSELFLDPVVKVCDGFQHDSEALNSTRPVRTDLVGYAHGSVAPTQADTDKYKTTGGQVGYFLLPSVTLTLSGLKWPAQNVNHYLMNTGSTVNLDKSEMYEAVTKDNIPDVIAGLVSLNGANTPVGGYFDSSTVPQSFMTPRDRRSKTGSPSNNEANMTITPGWFRILSPDKLNSDYTGSRGWDLPNRLAVALGSYDLRFQGRRTPRALCFRVFLTDEYMFEPTGLAAWPGTLDDDFLRWHQVGLAKRYSIFGATTATCYLRPGWTKIRCTKDFLF